MMAVPVTTTVAIPDIVVDIVVDIAAVSAMLLQNTVVAAVSKVLAGVHKKQKEESTPQGQIALASSS